jgi:hypothetical protein
MFLWLNNWYKNTFPLILAYNARYQVLTAVTIKVTVFCDVMVHSLVEEKHLLRHNVLLVPGNFRRAETYKLVVQHA